MSITTTDVKTGAAPVRLDAICVLGVSPVRATFIRRLEKAISLYEVYDRSAKILLCGRFWGGYLHDQRAPNQNLKVECFEMWNYLRGKDVRDQDILMESNSYNTLGNIINANEQFIKPMHWRSVAIITHGEHMEKVQNIISKVLDPSLSIELIDSGDTFSIYADQGQTRGDGSRIDFRSMEELKAHPYYR